MSDAQVLDEARNLFEQAKADPCGVLPDAIRLSRSADPKDRTAGLWAAGAAYFELGDSARAVDVLVEATHGCSDVMTNWIEISLASAEASAGRIDMANTRLDRIISSAENQVLAGHDHQRNILGAALLTGGLLRLNIGRVQEALDLSQRACRVLSESDGERTVLARAAGNAGVCHMLLGQMDAAERELTRSSELAEITGQALVLAGNNQNLAYTRMCLGDLPGAIERGRRALALYQELGEAGRNLSTLYDDLAEIHRFAGLTKDALRYARLSSWVARQGSNLEKQSDAEYRRARCLLDHGNVEAAGSSAHKAAEMFAQAGRSVWVQRARLLALEAVVSGTQAGLGDPRSAEDRIAAIVADIKEITAELTQAGWSGESIAARNLAATVVADLGDPETARGFLADNPPWMEMESENISDHLEGLYGAALAQQLVGEDNSRLLEAARAVVDGSSAGLVDPELRAGVARQLSRFRSLDLDRVVSAGADPFALVEAEERWRDVSSASAMSFADIEADSDLLSKLRLLHQERSALTEHNAELDAGIIELEREIRQRSMARAVPETVAVSAGAFGVSGSSDRCCSRELLAERIDSLKDGAFGAPSVVAFVEHRGELIGVGFNLGDEGEAVWSAGPIDDLKTDLERASVDFGRILTSPSNSRTVGPRWAALQDDYRRIGARLFGDVAVDGRPLVVAPPFQLGAVPWSLIADQASMVSVVGGVGQWCREAAGEPPMTAGVISAPDLPAASVDTEALLARFDHEAVAQVEGDEATSERLLAMLASHDLVHVSAHCSFRDDSVMFSSVEMADGPVPIYELGRLPDTPSLVVLAACGAGRWQDVGAAQWLGIAPELLRSGTDCLVAPIQVVADTDAGQVMTAFYRSLAELGAAGALAQAQAELAESAPRLQAAAHAFLVFGAALMGRHVAAAASHVRGEANSSFPVG